MLDVHAPDHTPHTWRDFFIHIATIVVGLLIAVGLEQSVELMHRHHQLHLAEHNLQIEFDENRQTLAKDEEQIKLQAQRLSETLQNIDNIRKHEPVQHLATGWTWNSLSSAAWDTARNNGTTSLMSYEHAQAAADLYSQQEAVNSQASIYLDDVYRMMAPLAGHKYPDQLSPTQLDRFEENTQQALADINHLMDLCTSLDVMNHDYQARSK